VLGFMKRFHEVSNIIPPNNTMMLSAKIVAIDMFFTSLLLIWLAVEYYYRKLCTN
jgi:hypothetical protein